MPTISVTIWLKWPWLFVPITNCNYLLIKPSVTSGVNSVQPQTLQIKSYGVTDKHTFTRSLMYVGSPSKSLTRNLI